MSEEMIDTIASSEPVQGEKRVLPGDSYDFLFGELDFLRAKGTIDERAIDAARAFYSRRVEESSRNTLFVVLVLLGVLAVGCAGYVLLRDAWDALTPLAKLIWSSAPFLLAYALFYVFRATKKEFVADVCLFAGAGLFWFFASTAYSSSYFLRDLAFDRYDNLPWFLTAASTFSAAFFSKRDSLHYLAVFFIGCALIASLNLYCKNECRLYWRCYTYGPAFAIALGGLWSYVRASKTVGNCYALLAIAWGAILVIRHSFYNGWYLLIFLGAFLASLLSVARQRGFSLGLGRAGAYMLLASAAAVLSHDFAHKDFTGRDHELPILILLLIVAFAVGSVILSVFLYRMFGAKYPDRPKMVRLLDSLLAPEALAVLALPLCWIDSWGERYSYISIVYANTLFVALVVSFLTTGARNDRARFCAGVFGFVLWLLIHVADSLFNDGIGAVLLLLLVAAVVLFGVAWMTRKIEKKSGAAEGTDAAEQILDRAPAALMPERVAFLGLTIAIVVQAAFVLWGYVSMR